MRASARRRASVGCRTCRPVPMQGVASMYADSSRAGVFVPASLSTPPSRADVGRTPQKRGGRLTRGLIPGGLKRIRLPCRDVSSPPSSGPVYGGPCIGSVLAPIHSHAIRFHDSKLVRTRFPPSLLTRFARSLRLGPPRYRVVNAGKDVIPTGSARTPAEPRWVGTRRRRRR